MKKQFNIFKIINKFRTLYLAEIGFIKKLYELFVQSQKNVNKKYTWIVKNNIKAQDLIDKFIDSIYFQVVQQKRFKDAIKKNEFQSNDIQKALILILLLYGRKYAGKILKQYKLIRNKILQGPDYIAPEVLKGESLTNSSLDYWSLGVIMYEMLCGIPPFNDDSVEKIFDNILNYRIEWPNVSDVEEESISHNAYDLMCRLMEPDYTKRIGHLDINQIKQHSFFNGIHWNTILQNPGLIVPKMVLKDRENEGKNCEKVQQFLHNLEKKEVKNQTLASKLKSQLSNLERLDLLVKLSLEEANDKLSKIRDNENKFKRMLNKIDHYEQEHQTQMVLLYEDIF